MTLTAKNNYNMKNLSVICLLLFACFQGISQTNYSNIDISFLVDATDRELFAICKEDIKTNFGIFIKQTGFGDVKPGQSLTMRWGMIGGSGTLEIESASIVGPSQKQSLQIQRKLLNPAKLIQLRDSKLNEFEKKASTNLVNTSIIDVLLKTILEANTDGESYIVVFSDLIENNKYLNFYKRIPVEKDILKIIQSSIDPYVKNKLQQKLDEGSEPHIVLVLKDLPNSKVDARKIKIYWQNLLTELGLTNVQFVDNLTNNIEL